MSLTRGQRKASRKEKNSKGYSSAEGNCQARAFSMKHFPRFLTMGRLRNLTTRFFFLCVFQCFQHRVGIAFSVKHFDMEKLHHVFNYELKGAEQR